jgi:hypothetical protein
MIWLFCIVISASVGADFSMILCESAFFSNICKPTSLRIVPYQVTAQASVAQAPWSMP